MYDLTIVGAGPAGLAAAQIAEERGLSVLVVDEQQRPGGQIFRQPPAAFPGATATYSAGYSWGRDLTDLPSRRPGIQWRFGTTAFGVLHEGNGADEHLRLALHGPDGTDAAPTRRLLIATGAYDLPVAFPGWTLPGVLTAGAVQSLLKSQNLVAPGPFVLAGLHPLLLVVADQLLRSGAEIAEVAVARRLPSISQVVSSTAAVPGHLSMFAELTGTVRRLIAAGVKVRTNTIVTHAHGTDQLESVELASATGRGGDRPNGQPRIVDAGTLVLGYGFLPSTDLARQARCAMRWVSAAGGWVVTHDERMRTSDPNIYVAGEPTGVAGANRSRDEGALAGLSVVEDLRGPGAVSEAEVKHARRTLRREARFSGTVQRLFEPDRALLTRLSTPESVVCRCELVRRKDIDTVLEANPGMSTVNAVKLECRSGMGPCQGRYCESTVAGIVADQRSQGVEEGGYFNAHLPLRPVPLTALAELGEPV